MMWWVGICLVAVVSWAAVGAFGQQADGGEPSARPDASLPPELPLWPAEPPGFDPGKLPFRGYAEQWLRAADDGRRLVRWVTTAPSVQVFAPPTGPGGGDAAVVVAAGGGYNIIEIEREGYRVARELNRRGVLAAVLKYRHYDPDAALADAHRAIRLVRGRAAEWGVRPDRVGMIGFSAGAHLATRAAVDRDLPEAWAKDAVDGQDKRPSFVGLVYGERGLTSSEPVPADMPPAFILGSLGDDADQRVHLYLRLLYAGAKAELHLFQTGEHGFGVDPQTQPGAAWVDLFARWLDANGLRDPSSAQPTAK